MIGSCPAFLLKNKKIRKFLFSDRLILPHFGDFFKSCSFAPKGVLSISNNLKGVDNYEQHDRVGELFRTSLSL